MRQRNGQTAYGSMVVQMDVLCTSIGVKVDGGLWEISDLVIRCRRHSSARSRSSRPSSSDSGLVSVRFRSVAQRCDASTTFNRPPFRPLFFFFFFFHHGITESSRCLWWKCFSFCAVCLFVFPRFEHWTLVVSLAFYFCYSITVWNGNHVPLHWFINT